MTDTLASHPSAHIIKLLNIGESGTGKTGAMASLARAGFNLFILDYDNGLDILANVLRDDPKALARVRYKTFKDKVTLKRGIPQLKPPVIAYKGAGQTLTEWTEERGPFTPADVLVIDTLTTFSEAAFNEAASIASRDGSTRLNQRASLPDFGWMAESVKLFIGMITDPAEFNCHVIVNTHIRYLGNEEEQLTQAPAIARPGEAAFSAVRGLPNAKGQEISRTVSLYFNTVLLTKTQGSGPGARRMMTTQPQGVIEVKTSSPSKVKATYPVDTGLAQLFEDILGHAGPSSSSSTKIKEQVVTIQ